MIFWILSWVKNEICDYDHEDHYELLSARNACSSLSSFSSSNKNVEKVWRKCGYPYWFHHCPEVTFQPYLTFSPRLISSIKFGSNVDQIASQDLGQWNLAMMQPHNVTSGRFLSPDCYRYLMGKHSLSPPPVLVNTDLSLVRTLIQMSRMAEAQWPGLSISLPLMLHSARR